MQNRLIMLAHPDDEMLCLPFLLGEEVKGAVTDYYFYLTLNTAPKNRVLESHKAIALLNRELRPSYLVHEDTMLRDGFIWKDFKSKDLDALEISLTRLKINSILTFAYEGGHQDHDFTNVIAKNLQTKLGIKLTEFSGYRKHNHLPIFMVCSPSARLLKVNFPRRKAMKLFIMLARIHRSQFRVWCLLAPPILMKLLVGSAFTTVSAFVSPQPRRNFLYELRGKATSEQVENAILKKVETGSKG